jgi:hypothetical protein
MRIVSTSILPTTETLIECRAGLTRHIRKTKSEIAQTRDYDLRNHFKSKLHKLQIIRDEIQFLIDAL